MDDDGDAVIETSDEDNLDGADDDEAMDSEEERENKLTRTGSRTRWFI